MYYLASVNIRKNIIQIVMHKSFLYAILYIHSLTNHELRFCECDLNLHIKELNNSNIYILISLVSNLNVPLYNGLLSKYEQYC